MHRHRNGGVTYFSRRFGFAINEGGTPFNLTVRWGLAPGAYVYLFGKRFWYFKQVKPRFEVLDGGRQTD